MRLEGKTAIITGGAGSMGREDVRLFTREGADVVIVDRATADGQELADEVNALAGGRAVFVDANVSNAADWKKLVEFTLDEFGKIDILVNNAGVSSSINAVPGSRLFDDMFEEAAYQTILDVNLRGAFLGVKHVIPFMSMANRGSIVNISSIAALRGADGGHLAYGSSKAGVASLSRTIAVRFGPYGIRCNSISPGPMPPMRTRGRSAWASNRHRSVVQSTALKRDGQAIDVAWTVLFLASDEAAYITGVDLPVDGGVVAR